MDFLFKLLLFLQVAVLIVVVQKSTLYVSGNVFEKAALDTFADSYLVKDAHAKQHCAMYGICGSRKDGRALNCPYPTPAVKPDTAFSNKIQSLCPTITGDVCCTPDQFDLLRSQVQQAVPFLTGCPACLRNFLNLFCEFSCSPDQSLFLNVTSIVKEGTVSSVEGLDFFVTEEFGKNLFDSCKDVKFGSMNTRAMDFIGAGAKTFQEWFSFIGAKAGLYAPGSPFAIRFRTSAPKLSSIRPLNTTMVPCWDSSLSCSCGDCPTAKYCSQAPPTPTNHTSVCAVHIGGNQIRCIDLAMGVIYVMLLLGIAIWWWNSGRVKKMTTQEIAEPLLFAQGTSQDLPPTSGSIEIVPSEVHGEQDTSKEKVSWSFTEVLLSSWFRSQGVWIARHPGLVLLASISIVALLCIGLVRLEVETRPEKLWVSPGSTAASEKNFFDTHLAPFYRIEQLIFSTIPDGKQNLLPPIVTDQNILLMFDIQKKIDELRGNFSGKLVSLQDICTKPLGNECATQSILQYFRMQRSEFAQYGGVSHAAFCFQHYTSSAPCLSAYEAPTDPKTILGGFSGTNYSEATTLVVTYPVQNFVDESGKANAESVAWEEAFIQLAKENLSSMAAAHNLTLAYSSESSIQFELQRESSADVPTILLSYLVMFLYIAISLGDYQPSIAPFYVSSKVMLALSGILIVALSVLGSVGLFSALGIKSTLIIAEVIPFLVLAVGVDNMCILVHAMKRQDARLPVDGRVGHALAEVGPSITLASLSEVLAFGVGCFTPMPACRVFSMFAAVAVLLDFLLQVTAFVALITYDIKREESDRVDCFPCISVPLEREDEASISEEQQQARGPLVWYMQKIHAPFLQLRLVKAAVLAIFCAMFLASIALSTRLSVGLDQKVVLPRDSYLQGYFNNMTEFLRVGPPVYLVVQDYNYSAASNQTNLICSISNCDPNSLLSEVAKAARVPETSYIASPAASWLDDFLVWLSPNAFGCCRKFPNGEYCPPDDQAPCCPAWEDYCGQSEICKDCTTCFLLSDLHEGRPSTKQFRDKLPWFLKALPSADCAKGGHAAYSNSIDLQGYESGTIKASEFRTYHTPLNKQSDFINALRATKEFTARMSNDLKIKMFPYSVFYIFFEQYLDIWKTTLTILALALGAVFVISLTITNSFYVSAIILLVLAMIVVNLMGLMVLWNIQLNAVSVVNLVMSAGIAVEFCVHITHAFSVSTGDKSERATKALLTMGASVLSGITLTKLVGVLVLFFSKSEIFVVYYFRMYLGLVLLGFLHGLIFLPVFLSIFGPPPIASIVEKDIILEQFDK